MTAQALWFTAITTAICLWRVPGGAWVARLIGVAMLLAVVLPAAAADRAPAKPSAALCWLARQARDIAGSDEGAEELARARGVSEDTIASAKRCPR